MNIWVIGRNYPSEYNNMQGSFELDQAKMLSRHGHRITYISCTFHARKKSKKWGYDAWNEDGISIYSYAQPFFPERLKIHMREFKDKTWKKLLSVIEHEIGMPDIIHIHYPSYLGSSEVFTDFQKRGVKIVCTEHWTHVLNKTLDTYETGELRHYVDCADTFICVGKKLRNAVVDITKMNKAVFVIPDMVDTDIFRPVTKSSYGFKFVAVGSFLAHKQFDKIVAAFTNRFKDVPDVTITLVGDGPEAAAIKRQILKEGVQRQISMTGPLDRAETAEAVAASDCLICYSRLETFGVPVIEAWACGIPVIASNAVDVISPWDDSLGIEVDPDNISELESAMWKIYQQKDKFDADRIVEFARKFYSGEAVYEDLIDHYTNDKA